MGQGVVLGHFPPALPGFDRYNGYIYTVTFLDDPAGLGVI